MDYEDLVVELRSTPEGRIRVELRDGAFLRGGEEHEELPVSPEVAEQWYEWQRENRVSVSDPQHLWNRVGKLLYETVFGQGQQQRIRDNLKALARAPLSEPRGLRVRLMFGLPGQGAITEDPNLLADYQRFGSLPWEMMCAPKARRPLALDLSTPIVRTLDHHSRVPPVQVELPIRVLVASCQPLALGELDIGTEKAWIEQALSDRDVVDADFAHDLTPEELGRKLAQGRYNVLHFIGHGGFHQGRGEGFLSFRQPGAKPDDDVRRVNGQELARLLSGCRDLCLVVLNSCRSAQFPRQPGQNPWLSTAAALSLGGVPAVIAMQYKISNPAAVRFSAAFYESLAQGRTSLEEALTDARQAMGPSSAEAAAPVLFLRGKNGRLLRLDGRSELLGHERDPALVLGIRSFRHWNDKPITHADRMLPLSRHFKGRPIRRPKLWQQEVLPRLHRFLGKAAAERRPLNFLFAAHQSIAYACGFFLEAKSGIRLGVLQPTRNQTMGSTASVWVADKGEVPEGESWHKLGDYDGELAVPLDADSPDVAVAIGISTSTLPMVPEYLIEKGPRVRRLIVAEVEKPGQNAVQSGRHAAALADALARFLHERPKAERDGVVHLFASAPNAFLVYLGQHTTEIPRLQLYEYDREGKGGYTPSFALPWPPVAEATVKPVSSRRSHAAFSS